MSAIYKNGIAYGGAASAANLISATDASGGASNVQAQLNSLNDNLKETQIKTVLGDLIQATDLQDFFKKALKYINTQTAPSRMGGSAAIGWSGHGYYIFSFARYGTTVLEARAMAAGRTKPDYTLFYNSQTQVLQMYERPTPQNYIIARTSQQFTVNNATHITINNPAPSGYNFLCHTEIITSGFTAGVTYANNANNTTIWFDKTVSSGTLKVISLFRKI